MLRGLEGRGGVGTPVQEQKEGPYPRWLPGETPRGCQLQLFAPDVGGRRPFQLDAVGPDLSRASRPPPPTSPTRQHPVVTVTQGVQLTRHPSKGGQGAAPERTAAHCPTPLHIWAGRL